MEHERVFFIGGKSNLSLLFVLASVFVVSALFISIYGTSAQLDCAATASWAQRRAAMTITPLPATAAVLSVPWRPMECTGQPSVCTTINPPLPNSCGIDIALIIDNSGSISSSELTAMKNAFKDFVDSFLPDTPTQMAVVRFNTNGDLVLDYNGDATTIKNAIDSVPTTNGFTNWDDGLKEAQDEFDNSAKPDLYIFASDGEPNRYGDPAQGSGSGLDINALNVAIARANAIKLSGVRIITLGIGVTGGNAANLQAISSADAYYDSDFDVLADTLAALAEELCGGTITVKKS